jgi:CubicO group peptidase (beta-lactamase class C family)
MAATLTRLLVTSVILLSGIPCIAQRIPAGLDQFIKTEMRRQQIPGLSIAVVKNGKPILIKGYGFSNIEHQVPVKQETIFQSGSVAKQFTAAAVMILVEDGKLSLDDRINKYFADVPASWNRITLRHLLNHTSGLGDYPPDVDLLREYTEDH